MKVATDWNTVDGGPKMDPNSPAEDEEDEDSLGPNRSEVKDEEEEEPPTCCFFALSISYVMN